MELNTQGLPYGGVINWALPGGKSVHSPSVHHGYRHIVAWGVHLGSHAYYIEMQCAKAKEQGAPLDAIYLGGTEWGPAEERVWHTFSEIKRPENTQAIGEYVEAMIKMEGKK